jgi:hypothetical protein
MLIDKPLYIRAHLFFVALQETLTVSEKCILAVYHCFPIFGNQLKLAGKAWNIAELLKSMV